MKNVFTIFTSPGETFERIRGSKAAWILPTILAIIMSLVSIALQMPYLLDFTRETWLKMGNIDPAQIEQMLGMTVVTSYVGAVIGIIFMVFLIALLLVLLNLIVRGEGKYMQFVSVAAYAGLPTAIGTLLTSVLLVAMDAKSLGDVSLSLGALVADKTGMMYKILSLVNPFSIWGLYLYVVGAAIMMQRPRKKIAIWIVAVWVIYSLIMIFTAPAV
ncbi:Yip1 family protein [Paenibacillus ihumii]|uniref:Yip1 family protein n=1 Tax=Paenibacillus ihumii TaxID=687436 RepID=UPI0006D7AB62|nr:Yip1 family protein [Paenibacillus ihumii]